MLSLKRLAVLAALGLTFVLGAAIAGPNTWPVPSGVFPAAGQVATSLDDHTVGTAPTGFVQQMAVYSQTITPASVGAAVCAEQTFTVTGLTTADKVSYNAPATGNATSAAQWRVSATNTIAIMYCNPTAGALTPGAGTGTIIAFRS